MIISFDLTELPEEIIIKIIYWIQLFDTWLMEHNFLGFIVSIILGLIVASILFFMEYNGYIHI